MVRSLLTQEMMTQIKRIVEKHKNTKGALIPVLHEVQEVCGYLPLEVQKVISEELKVPVSEIYGVVTFYTQFSLKPKGKYKINVCLGTACYVKGSGKIIEEIEELLDIKSGECTSDQKFSLEACRCIGACGLAPVMMINDAVYGRLKPGEVGQILEQY